MLYTWVTRDRDFADGRTTNRDNISIFWKNALKTIDRNWFESDIQLHNFNGIVESVSKNMFCHSCKLFIEKYAFVKQRDLNKWDYVESKSTAL